MRHGRYWPKVDLHKALTRLSGNTAKADAWRLVLDSDKLNRWLTLGANLGVVIGLVFLAIEVRQNNENLATQVRATAFFGMAETWNMVAENPALATAIQKDMDRLHSHLMNIDMRYNQ